MLSIVRHLGVVAIGLALGAGTAYLATSANVSGNVVHNGIWSTDLTIGSEAAGLYTRASVAINGLLALRREETIYYSANKDAEGGTLTARCNYVLEGGDPQARWWSVTVYGTDGFLLPEAKGRYSVNKNNVVRVRGDTFQIALTADGRGPNGIPTGRGEFTLTLRLYNPSAGVASAPEKTPLPQLRKGSCR